ncbi:MAG: glucose-6-phosphate isomerase [Phycisphaerales bacterium]|nr:glucose-6-phosphate isomerase [Phycisphaerales bacterium]
MSKVWAALNEHRQELSEVSLRTLCDNSSRTERFLHEVCGITVDLTRHLADDRTLDLLLNLAEESNLLDLRNAMFAGEHVNTTEQRAALHVALRNRSTDPMLVDGDDVMPQVRDVLDRMQSFCNAIHSGSWTGATGRQITDVINIGIGGSDLGPAMAASALRPWWISGIRTHFVSNVDPSHLSDTLQSLDVESTLFIIASKTFGTQETIANACAARRWVTDTLGESAVANHFVAVSTNAARVADFGIDTKNMFEFWDWVGGRYSMWSAIGLSIAVAIGFDRFAEMLDGAHCVDNHFRNTPPETNVPVLLGLLDCWYRDCWGCQSRAVLPYDQHLAQLPAYLQQLEMESNGKQIRLDGSKATHGTASVLWGASGTNGQHSFHQMLHQGTTMVPCDFLVAAMTSSDASDDRHAMLIANCLAQSEALARGCTLDELDAPSDLAPHKVMPGNRPSTTFVYRQLDPFTLGAIIALYEHRVFVQGVIWNIDSFDQWGVELGKKIANRILPGLLEDGAPDGDPTTLRLIQRIAELSDGQNR